MSYLFTVTTVLRSASEVLAILDRQARRDARKVTRFSVRAAQVLTGKQAIATYRSLWQLFLICCQIAIALGMTARDWCNALVDSCLPVEVEAIADPWELPLAPETEPEPLPLLVAPSPVLLLPPAAIEHRVVPFVRPVRLIAQQIVTVMKSEVWAAMSPFDLRKECGRREIRWRNAHGKNRHLTKPEMIEMLIAAEASALTA